MRGGEDVEADGMEDEQHLDLAELCRLADSTPRTVRFYIAQGLLPGASGRGSAARYGRVHLERLQLIKRLQGQYLPLAEIRRALEQLDAEAQSPREAPGPQVAASAMQAPPAPGSSALDYIRTVLSSRPHERVAGSSGGPLPAPDAGPRSARRAAPASSAHDLAGRRAAPAPAASSSQPSWHKPSRSQWERISLSSDVELHIRRPLSPKDQKAVARLTTFAADLFEEGPS